jgi:hypothetical protein
MYPVKNNDVKKCHMNMHQNLLDLQVNTLKLKVIFALGNMSYQYLKSTYSSLEILKREHPTHVYRFHIKDEEYIKNYLESFKIV